MCRRDEERRRNNCNPFTKMIIPLDSEQWSRLETAYGSAKDVPGYLSEIYRNPTKVCAWNEDPWYFLWSSLCHQGDIFSASIAAVPHLLSAAQRASEGGLVFTSNCIALPIAIERARTNKSLAVDEDYFSHLRSINNLMRFLQGKTIDRTFTAVLDDAKRLLRSIGLLEIAQSPFTKEQLSDNTIGQNYFTFGDK